MFWPKVHRSVALTDVISFSAPQVGPDHSFGTDTAIRITHPTRAGFWADIEARQRARQGFTLATLNLDHVVKLRRDPIFLNAYLRHSHVVADGKPIVWLSHLAWRKVELIPGSELISPLSALAARLGVPVGLLGSTESTLEQAARALEAESPGLRIVAQIAPPFGLDVQGNQADLLLEQLEASGARLCFLALGAPKQEMLAVRGAERLPYCGFVSIGAGLDFIAGTQTRAPVWVRRLAMEWAWRIALHPRRLTRRYIDCFLILPSLGLSALQSRFRN